MRKMASFYEIAESLPYKSPESLNPSGKKGDLVDNLIQRAIGSAGRIKDNKTYAGIVLYTIKLSEAEFKQKFWPDIVNYVFPTSKTKKSASTNRMVNEHIVYIQQLCGCLPRPPEADAKKFYEALQKLQSKNKSSTSALKSLSEDLKSTKNAEKYLKMINRFPRAYSLSNEFETGVPIAPGSGVVTVKFPYEYDTSIGVVVQPKSE